MIPEARIALSCRWFRIFDPKNPESHDLESFNEVVKKKKNIILDANNKKATMTRFRIHESIRNESFLPVDTNMFHYRSLLHKKTPDFVVIKHHPLGFLWAFLLSDKTSRSYVVNMEKKTNKSSHSLQSIFFWSLYRPSCCIPNFSFKKITDRNVPHNGMVQ